MKDFLSIWRRSYSAVNTSDPPQTQHGYPETDPNGPNEDHYKTRRQSFLSGRRLSLEQGIPPIIDSFFYQRKSGEKTRQPKRKLNSPFSHHYAKFE